MKYKIEYEEIIRRINDVTIEVYDEETGEKIAEELAEKSSDFNCPDDILYALDDMGVEVLKTCEGAEDCEYEIL